MMKIVNTKCCEKWVKCGDFCAELVCYKNLNIAAELRGKYNQLSTGKILVNVGYTHEERWGK